MAEQNCMGCEEKKAIFILTDSEGVKEEVYCADCMANIFLNAPECIVKVEAI